MDILELDSKFRYQGVKEDLHPLKSIRPDTSWAFQYPTLVKEDSNNYQANRNLSSFIKNFKEKLPCLNPDFIDFDNLFVAGGCVRSVLFNTEIKDVDVFIYGLSQEEAEKRVTKFIKDIYRHYLNRSTGHYLEREDVVHKEKEGVVRSYRQQPDINSWEYDLKDKFRKIKEQYPLYFTDKADNFRIINSRHAVTIMVPTGRYDAVIPVQIVLRSYQTKSEILHGFDLGSSAVGFDGLEVYFTSLSKYCYEHMVNIFDHTRRSTTYEQRLVKYFDNYGPCFRIVLPNFDLNLLRTEYFKYGLEEVAQLPYLSFSYNKIDDFSVSVNRFFKRPDDKGVEGREMKSDSDYSLVHLVEDEYVLANHNLMQIIRDKSEFIHQIDLEETRNNYSTLDDFFKSWELGFDQNPIKWYQIDKFYQKSSTNLQDGKIDINTLRYDYHPSVLDDPSGFIQKCYFSGLIPEERNRLISDLVRRQKTFIRSKLEELNDVGHKSRLLNWHEGDPMSQLTSSINPILESSEEWYGRYFTTNPQPVNLVESQRHSSEAKPINSDDSEDDHDSDSSDGDSDGGDSDDGDENSD